MQAIIQLHTGQSNLPTPLEWPYSIETDEEQNLKIRLSESLIFFCLSFLLTIANRLHPRPPNSPRLRTLHKLPWHPVSTPWFICHRTGSRFNGSFEGDGT